MKQFNQIEASASLLLSQLTKDVVNGVNVSTQTVLYMDVLKKALIDSDNQVDKDLSALQKRLNETKN